ncbi:hypothetical protein Ae201684P_008535 [Aphanomyces euteiches]|nr:hypothetical protein Ae201684P_008535 [Aphanomyces euteiches]
MELEGCLINGNIYPRLDFASEIHGRRENCTVMQVWPAPLLQEKLPPLRRNALQPREVIYLRQIQRRSVVNDVLWRVTVRCLTQLHTLKILHRKQRAVENAMFIAACLSVVVQVVSVDLYLGFKMFQWEVSWVEDTKAIVSFLTAALLLALCIRYELATNIQIESHQVHADTKFYHPSSLLLGEFIMESLILLVHLPPKMDYTFSLLQFEALKATLDQNNMTCHATVYYDATGCYEEIEYGIHQFGFAIVGRMYLGWRFLRNLYGFYTNDIRLIGFLNNTDATSPWFTRKFVVRCWPLKYFVAMLLGIWIVIAVSVYQAERNTGNTNISSFYDAVYFAIVTITTVGYGDCTVLGDPGRFLCVTIGVVGGAVVTYACRVGVRGAMTLTPTEVSLLHTINARKHLLEFHNAAAAFIQIEWRRYLATTTATPRSLVSQRLQAHQIRVQRLRFRIHLRDSKLQTFTHPMDVLDNWSDKFLNLQKTKPSPTVGDTCDEIAAKLERHLERRHIPAKGPSLEVCPKPPWSRSLPIETTNRLGFDYDFNIFEEDELI